MMGTSEPCLLRLFSMLGETLEGEQWNPSEIQYEDPWT